METKQLWVLCSISIEDGEVAEILEVYDNRDDAQVRWDEETFSVGSDLEDNGVDEPDEYISNRDDLFFETRYNGDIWRVVVNEVKLNTPFFVKDKEE